MVEFQDMVQCQDCGTFYAPVYTVTGRIEPHCVKPWPAPGSELARIQASCRVGREPVQASYLDLTAIETRVLGQLIDKKV